MESGKGRIVDGAAAGLIVRVEQTNRLAARGDGHHDARGIGDPINPLIRQQRDHRLPIRIVDPQCLAGPEHRLQQVGLAARGHGDGALILAANGMSDQQA